MNLFKKIVRTSCSVIPVDLLLKLSGISSVYPYHHVVSDENLPHIKELYRYKNKKEFIKDLDWLLKHFEPIHPDALSEFAFQKKPPKKKCFLLSFDDGFRQVYDVIAPILKEKSLSAIFFINSSFLDNKELFYRSKLSLILNKAKSDILLSKKIAESISHPFSNYRELRKAILKIEYPDRLKADELGNIAELDFKDFLKKEKPYLTSPQVETLLRQGFVFGGHSIDHPNYKFLNTSEQCTQAILSTEFVSPFQQNPIKYFAFPHEDRQVKQEFFEKINTSVENYLFFGTQNQRTEKQNNVLHRFNAERPGENLRETISSILTYNFFLRLLGEQNVSRK